MNELSKNLLCVYMRAGIEIWVERDRAENFIKLLASPNPPQFTEIDGNLVNRADITGIFTPEAMSDMKRRKNGEWQCQKGTWHLKFQECSCHDSREEWKPEPSADFPRLTAQERKDGEATIEKMRGKIGKSM